MGATSLAVKPNIISIGVNITPRLLLELDIEYHRGQIYPKPVFPHYTVVSSDGEGEIDCIVIPSGNEADWKVRGKGSRVFRKYIIKAVSYYQNF